MAIPGSVAGGFFEEWGNRWWNWIGCMNSLPGTTAEQESAAREKDSKDKVSMIHAA
jgi:hypothetical protein